MTEEEWWSSENPLMMIRAVRDRVGTRKWRLFCCAVCRAIWDRVTDERLRGAVEAAEQFADGHGETEFDSACASASFIHREYEAARTCGESVGLNFFPMVAVLHAVARVVHPTAAIGFMREEPRPGETTEERDARYARARLKNRALLHDMLGPLPFRPVAFSPEWRTPTAVALARGMYDSRDFGAMPILADALQDAGCDSGNVLEHCRGPGPHVRGCWVVDLVLGKE